MILTASVPDYCLPLTCALKTDLWTMEAYYNEVPTIITDRKRIEIIRVRVKKEQVRITCFKFI